MKKINLIMLFAVVLGLLLMGPAMVSVARAAAQTKCPVMGLKTDEKLSSDYKGKRVKFCCKDCVDKFNADPDKYMKKMEAEGQTPSDIPK